MTLDANAYLALEVAVGVAQLDQFLELANLLKADQRLGDVHLQDIRKGEERDGNGKGVT